MSVCSFLGCESGIFKLNPHDFLTVKQRSEFHSHVELLMVSALQQQSIRRRLKSIAQSEGCRFNSLLFLKRVAVQRKRQSQVDVHEALAHSGALTFSTRLPVRLQHSVTSFPLQVGCSDTFCGGNFTSCLTLCARQVQLFPLGSPLATRRRLVWKMADCGTNCLQTFSTYCRTQKGFILAAEMVSSFPSSVHEVLVVADRPTPRKARGFSLLTESFHDFQPSTHWHSGRSLLLLLKTDEIVQSFYLLEKKSSSSCVCVCVCDANSLFAFEFIPSHIVFGIVLHR